MGFSKWCSGRIGAERRQQEELGVHVQDVGPVELSVRDPGSEFVIDFLPVIIQGDPRCLEHETLAWEEEAALPSYALAPSDRRYVEARLEKRRVACGEAVERWVSDPLP